MTRLVRGGVILSLIGMFVVIFDAQAETGYALSSAKDSQFELDSTFIDKSIVDTALTVETGTRETEQVIEQGQVKQQDKKIIEKTVSSKAVGGVSRGMFTATAYCLKGRTAMGHGVRPGLIAADPRVLPLGSRINLGAGSYSGSYLISDTGGGIKGRRLDIWMASCAEARRFGRRAVSVSMLGR